MERISNTQKFNAMILEKKTCSGDCTFARKKDECMVTSRIISQAACVGHWCFAQPEGKAERGLGS